MSGLACNICIACNKQLIDHENDDQNCNSDQCHRYNLKPHMAEFPEALLLATHSESQDKTNLTQPHHHLNSLHQKEDSAAIIIKALQEDFSEEWEEVDENHDLVSLNPMGISNDDEDKEEEEEEPDPTSCFMCDKQHKSIEKCMIHMHKHHGFFIPDVEYLKDPIGLFTHLGLKVKRDYTCLYCKHICRPFDSLEAVRNHMLAKNHCKVHYGDPRDDEEEGELEDFYDYSTSYIDENGKQLVIADGIADRIQLGAGGSELIITSRPTNDDKISTKIIGSREYLRYYRQKPRPSPNRIAITALLAAKHRSMCLSMVQSKGKTMTMKVMKQMNKSGVEAMRTKMGMKTNVICKLPKERCVMKR